MSRSYRKFPSKPAFEHDPPDWARRRTLERELLFKEQTTCFYEDIVFPQNYHPGDNNWSYRHQCICSKKEIREEFMLTIRHIINGYSVSQYLNHEAAFIEDFFRIKNNEWPNKKWLRNRGIKKAIREWQGDPIDVLYYLNRHGLIEQAVREECKRLMRK